MPSYRKTCYRTNPLYLLEVRYFISALITLTFDKKVKIEQQTNLSYTFASKIELKNTIIEQIVS